MSDTREVSDQVVGGMGMLSQLVEGVWRGGIRPAADAFSKGRNYPMVNAKMLERFAGVYPGGAPSKSMGAPNGGGLSVMSGLGAVTGLYGLGTGIYDAVTADGWNEQRITGIGNAVSSGIGAAGSILNMIPSVSGGFLGGLTSVGGAGIGGGGLAGNAFAASTWVGSGAGAGAATGTALATGGAVLGAGLGGYGFGKFADGYAKESGMLGGQTVGEWSQDKAFSVKDAVTDHLRGDDPGVIRDYLSSGVGWGLGAATWAGAGLGAATLSGLAGVGNGILNGAGAVGRGLLGLLPEKPNKEYPL